MEMSAKNSECIVALLKHVSSDAYIMQKLLRSFKEDKVWLPSNATKMTCPHCFLIPRFPLVLKCGYVSSYRCFPEWFKHSREPNLNYSRATVVLEDVMTLHNERLKRPSSLTAKMYDLAMMMCNNIRCTKKFNIDQINNHVPWLPVSNYKVSSHQVSLQEQYQWSTQACTGMSIPYILLLDMLWWVLRRSAYT